MRVGYDEDVASGGNEGRLCDPRPLTILPPTGQDPLLAQEEEESVQVPVILQYNDQIRPLLDAIDRLRLLMVMKEGVQLPTIIVVGDLSSGKYSVLNHLPVLVFLEARSTTHNEAAKSSKSNAREVQWQESPCRGIPHRNGHKSCN
ncbi:hypothetical protein QQP08_015773 [Theobroma cacao]|nr:hypothetical protein QQP08_015773 [Theobroma cacao]